MNLGIIDYINIFPVTYGIDKGKVDFNCDIFRGPPTKLNRMMSEGSVDVSFISSIEYARGNYNLLPFTISCDGPVKSVILVSDNPVNKVRSINLTSESATSVVLLKTLMKNYFKLDVSYTDSGDAELIIGDKALDIFSKSPNNLVDLGLEWKNFTGLPMVFGVLATQKSFSDQKQIGDLLLALEKSYEWGQNNMDEIVEFASSKTGIDQDIVSDYYKCLHFSYGEPEKSALTKFYGLAKDIGEISSIPSLDPLKG